MRSRLMLFALLFLALPCVAKDHAWRSGRLVSFKDESWTTSSTTPVNCNAGGGYANCVGGQTINFGHVTYYVDIMEGSKSYYASRTLNWRWQKSPKLTENSPVKFAIERDTLFLLDDDGREFKMFVGKKRNVSPAERLEECRTTMYELHEAYSDLPKVNAWLAGLKGADLLDTYTYNLECSSKSIELGDMPLLSQFEVVRAEMLVARAAQESPAESQTERALSAEGCDALAGKIEASPTKDMSSVEIAQASRRLYDCAMAAYKRAPTNWFLGTVRARQLLLVELVARQSGSAIGEHQTPPVLPSSNSPW